MRKKPNHKPRECRENMREYTKETPKIGDDPTAFSTPTAPGVIIRTAGTSSPETPTEECSDCKCTNLVSDQCKGECLCHHPELTPTEDTVVHPKTNLIVDYLDNAMGVECDNADWTYINEILLSHDAELARKIEGMPIRSYNISATQIRQFVDRDAVLALLSTKK